MKKPLIVIFLILLLDQTSKILVKTTMAIGEAIPVFGKWFYILFVENNGMAFGWELSEASWGKIFLGVFRIVAVVFLFWLLHYLVKKKVKDGPIVGLSLITAGALGNIIDGMFYGMIFGYAGFMQGRVVDMLYFPLFTFPQWVPFLGGEIFFSPIFNIADSAITIGIIYMIIFQWNFIKNFESIIGVEKQHGEKN